MTEYVGGNFDLRGDVTPELSIFKHDIPGLYCGYVDGLRLLNFRVGVGRQTCRRSISQESSARTFDNLSGRRFRREAGGDRGQEQRHQRLSNGRGVNHPKLSGERRRADLSVPLRSNGRHHFE